MTFYQKPRKNHYQPKVTYEELVEMTKYGLDKTRGNLSAINIEEVNSDLSLKRNNKIYIGGEVLDCDGMCGGYNLQFAFSCAFVINESLLKKTMK